MVDGNVYYIIQSFADTASEKWSNFSCSPGNSSSKSGLSHTDAYSYHDKIAHSRVRFFIINLI